MGLTVSRVMEVMEELAPAGLACDWDNVGLMVGDPGAPVSAVMVALDPLLSVVEAAAGANAQMLVTHHPLFFKPQPRLDFSTPLGKIVHTAVTRGIAIYAAHTNLDKTRDGVNEVLAGHLGLADTVPLSPCGDGEHGMGLVGTLPDPVSLARFADRVKERLGLAHVRMAGNPEMTVTRAAVCGGSGMSLAGDFFRSGAQVFVTGDVRYHDAQAVLEQGRAVVDAGHFASERPVVARLAKNLEAAFKAAGQEIRVIAYQEEEDPLFWA